MQIKQAQGYSKEKALETTGFDVEMEMMKNASQAWKKAGSPLSGKDLNKFFENYIKEKKAIGAFVVVNGSTDDTRTRPYSVINEVTDGKRKSKTVYQIKEAELKIKSSKVTNEAGEEENIQTAEVVSLGAVVGRADKKELAVKTMKELIEANKRNYAIEICKEVVEGKKYASYGIYTPSKSAKEGTFLFAIAQ